ncbi:hypothetical protein [Mesorhizobium sp. YM1C-6-2]|uniref:hypothetical protein n=1 Tax=Mesorhizobium sp. YM1C-6-2 TaxID=1827501 RepID=UPI000EF19554|nr:hypothetical protein [Mesorhizobium sp. YM1C-6-2]RLP23990.1 hypothetical protein D8676_18320 [Mesorhizobium sp. YM1C-6-2]
MQEILIDRKQVVRIHLDQLERCTKPDAPRAAEAIYASMAMRFLIDDNALGSVAHELGIAINVEVPAFEGVPLDQTILFAAGGYPYAGRLTDTYYAYRDPGLRSPHRLQYEENVKASPKNPPMISVKLTRFLATPCLALAGEIIDRAELIRYVANKCGGAHHHRSRSKFNHIQTRLTDVGHALLLRGDGLSVVFMETIGTAWFLLQSPGVVELRHALANGRGSGA